LFTSVSASQAYHEVASVFLHLWRPDHALQAWRGLFLEHVSLFSAVSSSMINQRTVLNKKFRVVGLVVIHGEREQHKQGRSGRLTISVTILAPARQITRSASPVPCVFNVVRVASTP
jgi:hypothetical protein